jgi:hypothetical protein
MYTASLCVCGRYAGDRVTYVPVLYVRPLIPLIFYGRSTHVFVVTHHARMSKNAESQSAEADKILQ